MTEAVRAACVMGWPVSHSRSPIIHGHWLKVHGLQGDYRREAVKPEDFPDFLRDLSKHGYVGGNVTMPHKDMALKMSEPDERARGVGAANTLWLDNGKLRSTNTDVEGFIGALDEAAPGWDKGINKAVIIGAGGAARAIAFGFVERKIPQIHVVNRTFEKAEAFRERFGPSIIPTRWADMGKALAGAEVVGNATPLGMMGYEELPIDLSQVAKNCVIGDAIYAPLETSLLKQAKARGLRTSDGLGMLLHQAGRGFELWFGVRPKVTKELRAIVEAELTKK
jgi:shikimate dehydrogenase